MVDPRIENLNVSEEQQIIAPDELKKLYPITEKQVQTVWEGQNTIKDILNGRDKRMLVIVGPCSIHDVKAAKEYAEKLQQLADELKDQLYIVMRVYFEKPRTTVGWKGQIGRAHV